MPNNRNFSPWQHFLHALAGVEADDPAPLDNVTALRHWKARFPARLETLLGPLPSPVPLDAEVVSSEDCGRYRRDKVVFDVEDHLSSPAWLLVPSIEVGEAAIALAGHPPDQHPQMLEPAHERAVAGAPVVICWLCPSSSFRPMRCPATRVRGRACP